MNRLLQRVARIKSPPASVPSGARFYAVGDIHGRLDLLEQLIEEIDADDAARPAASTTLIFLGDLVDRGPDSFGVVERLIALGQERPSTRFILGNHEQVFLDAAAGDPVATRYWVRMGGRATILSYGIGEDEYSTLDYPMLARRFSELVPKEHIGFLNCFEDSLEVGDYLFVHAGLRPGVPIDQQSLQDLRWIRGDFLNSNNNFGKIVVHGHTVTKDVDVRANRIGIDTGAYESGRLTALALEGSERWFIST